MADIVIANGRLYFEKNDANGNLGAGERYLAETTNLRIPVNTERLEVFSADEVVETKLVDKITRITRDFGLSFRDITLENLAMFFMGDTVTVTQSSGSITGEPHTVSQGLYYQLGRDIANPNGVRGIGNVVVKDQAGAVTYVEDTDYTIDLVTGRLFIIVGGAIADGDQIQVDYDTDANTRTRLITNQLGAQTGAMTIIEDNIHGKNRTWWIPLVTVTPDGDLQLKDRENPREIPLLCNVQTRAGYEQIYCDGVPV